MTGFLQAIAMMGAVTAATAALAAEPGPACAPIMSAMSKTMVADHATVTVMGPHTSNGITAGGVNYLQMDNAWQVSPISPKDNVARATENLHNAKAYTCQSLPDSSIDGVAVANYQTRTETDDGVVESKIAIAKSSGLAVQVENSVVSGVRGKSTYTTRYSYTGIHAPTVKK